MDYSGKIYIKYFSCTCLKIVHKTKFFDILLRLGHLHVQQTPKPLAQEPAEVPTLFLHSELRKRAFLDLDLFISS